MNTGTVTDDSRAAGFWLLSCIAILLALILLGGVTRLTGSGLSMVHWQPLHVLPPLSEQAWQEELQAYRQSPEYQGVNRGMSIEAFKRIYWFEFSHRLLARGLGLVFALPLIWFLWRRKLPEPLRWPLIGIFVLGGLQGYMGWFMVSSGLVDVPRVSPYRLAAHLSLALLIMALMLWFALGLLWSRPVVSLRSPLKRAATLTLILVSITIVSGAFVAGLKAGHVYNTFPLMAGRLVPEGFLGLDPVWRNLFENPATVQFLHRCLALTTLALCLYLPWRATRSDAPIAVRRIAWLIAFTALIQVTLGISTLLLFVPVPLAAAHQAGAVILLAELIVLRWMTSREWKPAKPFNALPDPVPGRSVRADPVDQRKWSVR